MSAEKANHQRINSSKSVEWYTPAKYIEAARTVLGSIELDPASSPAANRIIKADRYFTESDNGYLQEWRGRIFLNPPYGWCYPNGRRKEKGGLSAQGHWTQRLIEQHRAGNVTAAVLLVNANTSEKWFQPLWDYLLCFVNHRIRFIPGAGTDSRKQPTKGNAFVYFGHQAERFDRVFRGFGRGEIIEKQIQPRIND